MIDPKIIQSIGNLVAKDVQNKYPSIVIKFFADRVRDEIQIFIADKNTRSDHTGMLYSLGTIPPEQTTAVKDIAKFLENGIEKQVRIFLKVKDSDSP
jgi:hypothetical protein